MSLIFKFKHAKLSDSGSKETTLCPFLAAYSENKPILAPTSTKTEFFSKNTKITSQGFIITDKGNKIEFNGKTKLLLDK